MTHFIINTTSPDEVLRLSSCVKNDEVSDVFTGNILHKGEDIPVFLKCYSLEIGQRSLLNEIIGYLVCKTYDIPQPEQAFIVFVPKIKVLHLMASTTQRFKRINMQTEYIPMFATQRLNGTNLAVRYDHSMERVIVLLRRWLYFKQACIGDEVLANRDRLPRNILYLGDNQFWVIDNGVLACDEGINWRISDLNPDKNYANFLADLQIKDIQADPRKGNAIIHEAHKIQNDINTVSNECRYWINQFSPDSDKLAWQNFLTFLTVREGNIVNLLVKRYGMLI